MMNTWKRYLHSLFLLLAVMISSLIIGCGTESVSESAAAESTAEVSVEETEDSAETDAQKESESEEDEADSDAAEEESTDEDVYEEEESSADTEEEVQQYYFRNEKLLNSHYEKHGIEMGFASAEEYEAAASDVINNPNALHKQEQEDNDEVYYVEETNEFAVLSEDGYIRTYFYPDKGIDYYNRQ